VQKPCAAVRQHVDTGSRRRRADTHDGGMTTANQMLVGGRADRDHAEANEQHEHEKFLHTASFGGVARRGKRQTIRPPILGEGSAARQP
jgi:hypothetical protein